MLIFFVNNSPPNTIVCNTLNLNYNIFKQIKTAVGCLYQIINGKVKVYFISYIIRAVISLGSMSVHFGGILISLSEIFRRSVKLIG